MTQKTRLLSYLRQHGVITTLSAIEKLGILSLSRRICDLKRDGHDISTILITIRNRFGEETKIARYRLNG